ncbi:hypothetical protein QUF72_17980 [Desulfobacterales bacterium HSG2]|nr:hypothetical protein [Desulfobacterales bacterium HSG2]
MPGNLAIPREREGVIRAGVIHAGGFGNPPGAWRGHPYRGIWQSPGSEKGSSVPGDLAIPREREGVSRAGGFGNPPGA